MTGKAWWQTDLGRTALISVAPLVVGVLVLIVWQQSKPVVYTPEQFHNRFLLKFVDEVERDLGPADNVGVNEYGLITGLYYKSVPLMVNGQVKAVPVQFFAKGERVTLIDTRGHNPK